MRRDPVADEAVSIRWFYKYVNIAIQLLLVGISHPETVNPRLSSIAIQTHTIRISGQAIHNCPTRATRLVDLQAQVIVCSRDGVIMLMNDKMSAMGTPCVCAVE